MTRTQNNLFWAGRILNLLQILLFISIVLPATGYCSNLVLLYSNDIRGETDPCG